MKYLPLLECSGIYLEKAYCDSKDGSQENVTNLPMPPTYQFQLLGLNWALNPGKCPHIQVLQL